MSSTVRPPNSGSKIESLLNQNKYIIGSSNNSNNSNINSDASNINSDASNVPSSSSFENSVLTRLLLVEEEAKRLRQQLSSSRQEACRLKAENDMLRKQAGDRTYMITKTSELAGENEVRVRVRVRVRQGRWVANEHSKPKQE